MTMMGGTSWYNAWGSQQNPSGIPAGLLQGGGQNPVMVNNFFGAGGMATPQMLGTGHTQPNMIQSMLGMLGQMWPNQFGGMLPTGGMFSPMGQAQMMRQQADLNAVMQHASTIDQQHFTEMYARLNRHIMGPGSPDIMGASRAEAMATVGVLNSQVLTGIQNMIPGVRSAIEMFNPLGSTSATMASTLYAQSRHLGTTVDDVNTMTDILADRYKPAGTGLPDPSFSYGLNQREIGEAAGAAMRAYVLDPAMVKGGDASARNQFANTVERYNEVAASLKDIFGPQGSVTDLFNKLNVMTSGGMSQMSSGDLAGLVSKMKMVSMTSGVSLQGMTALMAQGSMYGTQLGMPGPAGTQIALGSMQFTGDFLKLRERGAIWGQGVPNQIGNEVNQARFGISGSVGGIAGMGLLRLESDIAASGVDYTGNPAFRRLQALTGAIRSGSLSAGQIGQLEDVQGLSGWAGSLLGGQRSALAYLTNQRANSQFQGEFEPAIYSIMEHEAGRETLDAIAFNTDVSTFASRSGMKLKDASQLIYNTLKGSKTEAGRITALTDVLKSGFGSRAGLMATAMYSGIKGTLWDWGAPGKFGLDINAAKTDLLGALFESQRLQKEERFWTGTGVGRMGAVGQRMFRALTGEGKTTVNGLLAAAMGAPNAAEARQLAQALGGQGEADRLAGISGIAARLKEAHERGETEVSDELLAEMDQLGIPIEFGGMSVQQALTATGGAATGMFAEGGAFDLMATAGEGSKLGKLMGGLKYLTGKDVGVETIRGQGMKLLNFLKGEGGQKYFASIADTDRAGWVDLKAVQKELGDALDSGDVETMKNKLRMFQRQYGRAVSPFLKTKANGGFIMDMEGSEIAAMKPDEAGGIANISLADIGKAIFRNCEFHTGQGSNTEGNKPPDTDNTGKPGAS